MDFSDLALTAGRASVIYVFLLVVVRVLGKRTVKSSTAFDFMVALILGEVVDEPIYGDVPLLQGLVVIAVIAGWHAVNSYLSYRSERIDRLTGGSPNVLVRDGRLDREAMRHERVNEEELWSMLREHEIERLEEVAEATLEPSGTLSVRRAPHAQELTRGDLEKLRPAA